jgi:hypothetical protein
MFGDFLSSFMNYAKKIPAPTHSVAEYAPHVSGALKSIGLGTGAGRGDGRGNGYSAGELVGSVTGGKLLDTKSLKETGSSDLHTHQPFSLFSRRGGKKKPHFSRRLSYPQQVTSDEQRCPFRSKSSVLSPQFLSSAAAERRAALT